LQYPLLINDKRSWTIAKPTSAVATGGSNQVFNGRGIGLLHTFGTTRMLSNSRTANTNAGNGSGIANFK
jgi:hypothetical protein